LIRSIAVRDRVVLVCWLLAAAGGCGSSESHHDGGDAGGLDGAGLSGGGGTGGSGGAGGGGASGSGGTGACNANAGTLDTSFGVAGVVVAHFPTPAGANAVGVAADGRIVAGGGTILARFASNGELDSALIEAINGNAIAIQDDGKAVFAGSESETGGNSFVLLRFNADGTADQSFGSGGGVVTSFGLMEASVSALAIQRSDGAIIAGGDVGGQFALARYDRVRGALDASFGDGTGPAAGVVTTSFGTPIAAALAIALQDDGRIVAGGCAGTSSLCTTPAALARYTTGGTLDAAFGTAGKLVDAQLAAVAGIAIAGTGIVTIGGDAAARRAAGGAPDTTFAGGGKTRVSAGTTSALHAVAVAPSGRIVIAGVTLGGAGPAQQAVVFRLNADGSPDTCFGQSGVVTIMAGAGGVDSIARAVAWQPDGKIVVAGSAGSDMMLARISP